MTEVAKKPGEGFLVDPDNLDLTLNGHDIKSVDAEILEEEEAIEGGLQVYPGQLPAEEKPSNEELENESVLQQLRQKGQI